MTNGHRPVAWRWLGGHGRLARCSNRAVGSLLFSSYLRVYLPVAVGLALFSTAVTSAVAALTSSTKGVVAIPREIPAIALIPVVAAVATAIPAGVDESTRLATVMVALGLSTAIAGLAELVLVSHRIRLSVVFSRTPAG